MKHRLERVCEVIRRELSAIVTRDLIFSSPLVTISGVDITPDLKRAHVFVSAFGQASDKKNAIKILDQNRGMLQAQLARRVSMKHTPQLHFKLDDSVERGVRVLHILDDLGLDAGPKSTEEPTDGEQR